MGEAFWRFSLDVYGRADAPETCLALQDQFGADVNLALFALWSGLTAGVLTAPAAAAAAARSSAWAERAVRPIRALRRDLKRGVAEVGDALDVEAFRVEVKALELSAEKRQQFALAPLATGCRPPPGAAAARSNWALLGPPDRAAADLFERLLTTAQSDR